MASLVVSLIDGYHDLMDNKGDPRVKDWLLMSSPFPTLFICLTYVYCVKSLGPRLMANRKPFDLRNVLIAYNAFQVAFSAWLFYEACAGGWLAGYSLRCEPVDYSTTPKAMRVTAGCWWYYISKFTEFFDTIFFVLRKKDKHISKLHVIHHGIMPMSVWFGVKFFAGGHGTFFGLLNTFVHIVMYSYYLLAALGPQVQKYLWWKRYITVLQMVQFVLVMIHSFQLLFIECDYPKAFCGWIGMHAVMFYFLFSDYYKQEYLKKEARRKAVNDKKAEDEALKAAAEAQLSDGATGNGLYQDPGKLMQASYVDPNAPDNALRQRAFVTSR
ncbi:elongation of very long chain fatty acids protein AAEL008004-like [Thrips palmi]|uniref:Elongation of very long chain fatty acids protein n=1 Tax=Thrips palmi TaxID=161013 RepID=A0A6P8YYK3_THRPL|nr:elongation of very long chain fatty acids protein AAEL008004-like [Thrips palmi]